MTDPRQLHPRGRSLENTSILRGTARHETEEQVNAWFFWIGGDYPHVTSGDVLAVLLRSA